MREIKFRAWMKNRLSGEWFMDYQHDGTPKSWYLRSFFENYDAHHETFLMQYTGLHDKNGKEIYEGDIATVECECGYRANMPVEWGYNGFRLKKQWSHRFPSGELEFNHTERVEVIGNIYENPELLKEGR